MTAPGEPASTRRWNRTAILIAVVALAVVAVVGAVAWLGGGGQQRTVAALVSSSGEIHPVEATSELCGESGCVEGWTTDVGAYLRFDSVGEAEYWAIVLGDDGRRWENFVLDLTDTELTRDELRYAVDTLFGWHDWN